MAQAQTKKEAPVKKKTRKLLSDKGMVFVKSTFNNTIINVTDHKGGTVAISSPGVIGYKGSKKSTPYAASKAAEDAAQKAIKIGVREVHVYLRGVSAGRNSAVKGLRSGGLKISAISDITPIAHGGPRPKKMPRGS